MSNFFLIDSYPPLLLLFRVEKASLGGSKYPPKCTSMQVLCQGVFFSLGYTRKRPFVQLLLSVNNFFFTTQVSLSGYVARLHLSDNSYETHVSQHISLVFVDETLLVEITVQVWNAHKCSFGSQGRHTLGIECNSVPSTGVLRMLVGSRVGEGLTWSTINLIPPFLIPASK